MEYKKEKDFENDYLLLKNNPDKFKEYTKVDAVVDNVGNSLSVLFGGLEIKLSGIRVKDKEIIEKGDRLIKEAENRLKNYLANPKKYEKIYKKGN